MITKSIFNYMKKDKDMTFIEYIEEKMGDRLIMTISVEEIMDDFTMGLKDALYCIAILTKYKVERHRDYDWHFVIINAVHLKANKDREKDEMKRLF